MSALRAIRAMLTARQQRALLGMQLVSLLVALATAAGIAAIGPFFAVLGEPALIERNGWLRWLYLAGGFTSRRSLLLALGAGFVVLVLVANLVSLLGAVAMNRLALRIGTELQTTLFEEYLARPYAFHLHTHSSTLLNRVVYETTRLTHGVLENAFTLITSLATAALIVVSILAVNAPVAVGVVAALAGGYALLYHLASARLLRSGALQSQLGAEQTRIVSESFGAIREITLLQVREFFGRAFARASHDYLQAAGQARLIGQAPRHLMECVAAVGLVGLALVRSARDGGIGAWLGTLTFLAFAAYRLLPTLQQAFAALVRIRADQAALELIGPDLCRARAAARAPAAAARAPEQAWRERPRREICLEDVWYRYAPERAWALRGVSLRIAARTTVGIVGANGSGKSTLVDLIAGLLTPARGALRVDECVLGEDDRAAWQARIAYVPQSISLLDASLAENIALGVPPGAIDARRLAEAARLAQLEQLVSVLPRGYGARIGERGVALSGGQRQRIGIARALYRERDVLLLDEATQALDGLTEQELIATLARLHGRCTIVLIAHRLATVRACDQIFELADGRLAASGSCAGLLASSRAFRRLLGAG